MRISIIIGLLGLCVSCMNRQAKNELVKVQGKEECVHSICDSILIEGIRKLVDVSKNEKEFKSPNLSKSCLVMEFKVDTSNKVIFFSDTVIFLTHKICKRSYSIKEYKGILTIDSIHIAIFDKTNIGSRFYNMDSLKYVPFEKFECYNVKFNPCFGYYQRRGVLKFWDR